MASPERRHRRQGDEMLAPCRDSARRRRPRAHLGARPAPRRESSRGRAQDQVKIIEVDAPRPPLAVAQARRVGVWPCRAEDVARALRGASRGACAASRRDCGRGRAIRRRGVRLRLRTNRPRKTNGRRADGAEPDLDREDYPSIPSRLTSPKPIRLAVRRHRRRQERVSSSFAATAPPFSPPTRLSIAVGRRCRRPGRADRALRHDGPPVSRRSWLRPSPGGLGAMAPYTLSGPRAPPITAGERRRGRCRRRVPNRETGAEALFDAVAVVVAAPEKLSRARSGACAVAERSSRLIADDVKAVRATSHRERRLPGRPRCV